MSALDLATKTCTQCGETLPLSKFHRDRRKRDGRSSECGPCATKRTQEWHKKRRADMGDEAFKEYRRSLVAESRQRTGNVSGAESRRAYDAALGALRDLHRDEFDRLLAAERYERGLT